jgi:hypothetical protein
MMGEVADTICDGTQSLYASKFRRTMEAKKFEIGDNAGGWFYTIGFTNRECVV